MVTAPKVARDAITGDNIVDGSVPGSKIESGSITADQIQAGTITADEIRAGTITAENIASNTITAEQINARAIGSEEIAIGAIFAENIAAGAITADKIAANTIDANNIKANVQLESPVLNGGSGSFTGIVRATRIVTNDVIGVGPEDLENPVTPLPGDPPLAYSGFLRMRPAVNPATPTVNSQIELLNDGQVIVSALSFAAVTINGIKIAAVTHRHEDFTAHGQHHARTSPSDIRLKKDVEPLAHGLDFINALRPVQYRYINGDGSTILDEETMSPVLDEHGHEKTKFREGKRTHFGLIAQEVKEVVDEAGVDFGGYVIPHYDDDPDGYRELDYTELVAPLILAVQELSREVAAQREQIKILEERVQ